MKYIILIENRVDFLRSKYKDLKDNVFDQLYKIDPTKKKVYLDRIIRWYLNETFILGEDDNEIKASLEEFDQVKKKSAFPQEMRDINKYSSPGDLYKILNQYQVKAYGKEGISYNRSDILDHPGVKLVFETNRYLIVIIKTYEASSFLGKGTKWCTRNDRNTFNSYNRDGSLYVIFDKNEGKRYQAHKKSNQFMDEFDNKVENISNELHEAFLNNVKTDDNPIIVQTIKNYKDLPEDLARKLAEDIDYRVRWAIAKRPDLPEDVIRKLAEDKDKDYNVRWIIADRSDLPEDLIRKLAEDEDDRVRSTIADRSDLPEDLIRKLAEDEDDRVRSTIAKRPDLPEDLIRKLAEDEDYRVRSTIAERLDLPEDMIRELAKDEDWYVRRAIAKRSDLPEDLIRKLAEDENEYVRWAIAERLDLPEDVIRELAKDIDYRVRRAIARHPDLPEDLK
jgi:uncharacterized protein (DUF2336 family)